MPRNHNWLNVADVARLLQIPVVKVQRWAHQGKIPCKFSDQGVRFRREDLVLWAHSHDLTIMPSHAEKAGCRDRDDRLFQAVAAGGVEFDLEGKDVYSVLEAVSNRLRFDPPVPRDRVFEELLAREELASTGIGRGVAIPHPRNMCALNVNRPRITLFYLRQPVDFAAVDSQPVDLLFAMFSPDNPTHLGLLSRLGYLLRREDFSLHLRGCRLPEEALAMIRENEKTIFSGLDGSG
ncbi:MAG TPA: helix-turn-helix domain-containing protein [Candidatus Aminicenantes bacterium]|nr:helix-turn-helix domain-containing protein [Candidatus Aminicenantes bacterium]